MKKGMLSFDEALAQLIEGASPASDIAQVETIAD